jgi:hypothetical protein
MRDLLNDPDVMRDVLRRKLLRGACSAVSFLVAAARGEAESVTPDQFRAAATLAKLAPQLIGDLVADPDRFHGPQFWTPRRVIMLEFLDGHQLTREQCAMWWGNCFCHHGPQPPNFDTLEEARAYGEMRWDNHQGNLPNPALALRDALAAFERGEVCK